MTWAEFYAGEIGASSSALAVSYDAVSTATTRFATRFEGFTSETSDSGTTFTGVKGVQVRMAGDVYNSLSDKSRYTFSNDSFSEYKAADASGNFGAMSTETIDANAKLPDLAPAYSAHLPSRAPHRPAGHGCCASFRRSRSGPRQT